MDPLELHLTECEQTSYRNLEDVSRGYARTYCCPTRGIVLGLSRMGMVGMKGVVGGSEGRRGEWGDRS